MKHVLLLRLVRALQQKPKAFLYLDTHAGRGRYDLAAAAVGDSLSRAPEWPDGIGRVLNASATPPAVEEYVSLVRRFDRQCGNLEPAPRFYPGSPWLARCVGRPIDRLALCEKHPAECAALQEEFAARGRDEPRASVQEIDGYVAIRGMLPPPERRALVLIDPPFEAQDEFAQIAAALEEGLRRFPSAVYAVWYPLTERARVREFFDAVLALRPSPTLAAELEIAGYQSMRKMKGCGLLVVNPPWQFDIEAEAVLTFLAPVLAQEPGGGGRVEWLVPER